MKRIALALTVACGLAATPSFAQQFKISEDQARKIAADRGIVNIHEIEQDDGKWEIEGRDKDGREIEVDVHGQTGEVVKFERD